MKPGQDRSNEQLACRNRSATASLIRGILAFATAPGAVALADRGVDFTPSLLRGFITTGILLTLIAAVTDHCVKVVLKRSQGIISGEDTAIPGMVCGYQGLGIWSLAATFLVIPLVLHSRYTDHGNLGLGSLRIIDEAAAAYLCSCGYGNES